MCRDWKAARLEKLVPIVQDQCLHARHPVGDGRMLQTGQRLGRVAQRHSGCLNQHFIFSTSLTSASLHIRGVVPRALVTNRGNVTLCPLVHLQCRGAEFANPHECVPRVWKTSHVATKMFVAEWMRTDIRFWEGKKTKEKNSGRCHLRFDKIKSLAFILKPHVNSFLCAQTLRQT